MGQIQMSEQKLSTYHQTARRLSARWESAAKNLRSTGLEALPEGAELFRSA